MIEIYNNCKNLKSLIIDNCYQITVNCKSLFLPNENLEFFARNYEYDY